MLAYSTKSVIECPFLYTHTFIVHGILSCMLIRNYKHTAILIMYCINYVIRCVETVSHVGNCLINLIGKVETKLYTKYMGSKTKVEKIGQNVWQLAPYFHTPVCSVCMCVCVHI